MYTRTLIHTIASTLAAYQNCRKTPGHDWIAIHRQRLDDMAKDLLPSGSGIDSGTKIDVDASTPERIVLLTGFHHMNDGGYYDGWTEHKIIVSASLCFGLHIRIAGRDRNAIKEYLHETYDYALTRDVVWDPGSERYTLATAAQVPA